VPSDDEELRDERTQAGQRQADSAGDEEDTGDRRGDPLPAAEVGDPRAPAAATSIAATRKRPAVLKPWLIM
jgi:hypothetical protein